MAETNAELVKQLVALIDGGQAHTTFDEAIKDLPADLRGAVVPKLPYSIWQLVEHLRITQRDILNFSAPPTGGYQPLEWPADYWPKTAEPPSPYAWDQSVAAVRDDRDKLKALVSRPGVDLYKPFLWGDGQNLLREALLVGDHTAYHLGEIVVLRRLLGAWHT